jgi:hypothetical protein
MKVFGFHIGNLLHTSDASKPTRVSNIESSKSFQVVNAQKAIFDSHYWAAFRMLCNIHFVSIGI